jgi:hypothetical protein
VRLTYSKQRAVAAVLLAIDVLAILNWFFGWGLAGKFAAQAMTVTTILIVIAFYTVLTGKDQAEGK